MNEVVLNKSKNASMFTLIILGMVCYSNLSFAQTYVVYDSKTHKDGIDSVLIHQTLLKEFLIKDVAIYPEEINRLSKCISFVKVIIVDSLIISEKERFYLIKILTDSSLQSCYYYDDMKGHGYNYLISGVFKYPPLIVIKYDYNTSMLYRINGFSNLDLTELKRDFKPLFSSDKKRIKSWIENEN